MIKKITLLLCLVAHITAFCQDYDFGKVSKAELQEKYHPLDSTATAAYLYKYRKTYYNYNSKVGFEIINEYHVRIKIYSSSAFDYATFNLSYVRPEKGESERIYGIKAYTYNLNEKGKITDDKLQNKDIYDETSSKYRHLKKITMPNVKVGSVIELKYSMSSPYYDYIDDVAFQFDIPVKKLVCEIETPTWLIFAKKNKGYYSITPKETSRSSFLSFRTKVRTQTRYVGGVGGTTMDTSYENEKLDITYKTSVYEAEDIPALKNDEPFVANIKNYRGGVIYELVGTQYPNSTLKSFSKSWEDVSRQINKSSAFGDELSKTNYFEKELDPILQNSKSTNQKIADIYQFVKSHVKWNGYINKYTDKGVKKAYKEKVGNSAEINLMLTSMLRYAGLNANPVLVSSKGNGIPLFPTLKGFNYVISLVQFADNSYVLLDATEPFGMPNVLPVRALNWNGRLVTKDGNSTWVKLSSLNHATEENMVIAKLSDNLIVEGLMRTKYENLNALNFRKNYNHVDDDELIKKYEDNYKIEIEDFKVVNKDILSKPVIRNVKFISEDLVEEINGKFYVEPLLFLTQHKNPFKLEDRKFPVDFATAWKDENRVSLQIPDGYVVEKLPEPMAIALPENIGVFKYQVTTTGNKIKAFSILQFNSSMILPQYYTFLKDFYGKLVQRESEKIVLVKK